MRATIYNASNSLKVEDVLNGSFVFTGDRINYKYGFLFYDAGATGDFGVGSHEVSINLNNGNSAERSVLKKNFSVLLF